MRRLLNVLESVRHEGIVNSMWVDDMVDVQIDEVGASLSPLNL
jgi:hypothetical protein